MRRAGGVCSEPGCIGRPVRDGRCRTHALPAWAGSDERRRELGARVDSKLRRDVKRRARGKCERCGRAPRRGERPFVIDHVVPVSEGGPTTLANLELVCGDCDDVKTASDLARARAQQTAPARA